MTKVTKDKLNAIQKHIERNFKRWFKSYSGIEGVNVGLKKIKGQEIKGCYSVIFHVTKKKKSARKKVPKTMLIRIDGRRKLKIPTDVVEAGGLKLQGIKLGDQVQNDQSTIIGTIFFYFTSSTGTYLCSNMHVLGANLLKRGQLDFDVSKGDQPEAISFFDETISSTAQMQRGRFNRIDLAFARIDNPQIPQVIEIIIKTVGPVKGFFDLTPSNINTVNLSFLGSTSGFKNCVAVSLGAVKRTSFKNIFLTNLIKLERCTADGDSGAPLFDQKNRVVGIIVGRDKENSFAIPISDVIEFFQKSKL